MILPLPRRLIDGRAAREQRKTDFKFTAITLSQRSSVISENLRRSMLMGRGDPSLFLTRPISLGFLIATVLILVVMALPAINKRRGEIAG